jgi:hypothetical protein
LSKSETSNQQATENQRYRASDLNAVVAAITLWNTVYRERAIATLGQQCEIDDSLISHVAPLSWNHINLAGGLCMARQQARCQGTVPAVAHREIDQCVALTYEKIRFLRAFRTGAAIQHFEDRSDWQGISDRRLSSRSRFDQLGVVPSPLPLAVLLVGAAPGRSRHASTIGQNEEYCDRRPVELRLDD